MRRNQLAALLAVSVVLGGCTTGVCVTDFDRQVISASADNAEAISLLVHQDDDVPQYVKDWFDLEVQQWQHLESWSRGEPVDSN